MKLEDNKVSDWSENYLNYNELKAILKKAKVAQKKYEEHAKKKPKEAALILDAHKKGDAKFVTTTPPPSTSNLLAMLNPTSSTPPMTTPTQSNLDLASMEGTSAPNERTKLLSTPPQNPATATTIITSPTTGKEKVVKKKPSFTTTFSDITEYFGSRYERTLRGYLKERDEKALQFETLLLSEQKKVSQFYYEKLGELQKRLQVLLENVSDSPYVGRGLEKVEEEDGHNVYYSSPLPQRPSSSATSISKVNIEALISKFSTAIQKEKKALKRQKKEEISFGSSRVADEDMSDDDDEAGKEKDEKALAETDSIKRALIDQYRTAKLLHNFAILNYTGTHARKIHPSPLICITSLRDPCLLTNQSLYYLRYCRLCQDCQETRQITPRKQR